MQLHCPACETDLDAFAEGPGGRPAARCPECSALERHRFLAILIDRLAGAIGATAAVLEFAPSARIAARIRSLRPGRYLSVDLDGHFSPTVIADITRLPLPDGSVDFIVCYHVLEHVPADRRAMSELARVLGPSGIALVQVPRRRGALTDEDADAPVEERIRRFGQDDHVRLYGDDFERRLFEAGLVPSVVTPGMLLGQQDIARFGLHADEEVWFCQATSSASHFGTPTELRADRDRLEAELHRLRSHVAIRAALVLTRPLRRAIRSLRR